MSQPPPEESIAALAGRLVDDGKQFVRAEVALYRARLMPRIGNIRNAAILGVTALFLLQAILTAALVGLILILLPATGAGGATAIVVVGGLAVTALLGWLAWTQLRGAMAADKEHGS